MKGNCFLRLVLAEKKLNNLMGKNEEGIMGYYSMVNINHFLDRSKNIDFYTYEKNTGVIIFQPSR